LFDFWVSKIWNVFLNLFGQLDLIIVGGEPQSVLNDKVSIRVHDKI